MASKSLMLPLALLLAALAMLNSMTAFVGSSPALRSSKVARKAIEDELTREVVELFFTAPAQGERSRINVTPDTTAEELLKMGRKALGFDQDWIPDSDFKLYNAEDESKPITGPMKDNGLTNFGYEVHMYFEPASY
eukprot:gb/GFBE01083508.1/.p1 GENE.gb/GFBE01083508.1/~~gb/GFBE01083508.1/.p1  ORF type:complete len:136 (+),score=51.18 gb/GFBE01083508.1/:1-408(+)